MTTDSELPADVVAAIHARKKVNAIKLLRAERGIGLKEAKEIVDDYVSGLPPGIANPPGQVDSGVGRWVFVGLGIAAVYLAYRFLA